MENYYKIRLAIHAIVGSAIIYMIFTVDDFRLLVSNIFIYILSFVLDLWYPNYPEDELPWQTKLGKNILYTFTVIIMIVFTINFMGHEFQESFIFIGFKVISLPIVIYLMLLVLTDTYLNSENRILHRDKVKLQVSENIRNEKLKENKHKEDRVRRNKTDFREHITKSSYDNSIDKGQKNKNRRR